MNSQIMHNSRPNKAAPRRQCGSEQIKAHRANIDCNPVSIHWLADEFWLGYERIERAYCQWARITGDHGRPSDLGKQVGVVVGLMAEVCEELEAIAAAELEISATHGGS